MKEKFKGCFKKLWNSEALFAVISHMCGFCLMLLLVYPIFDVIFYHDTSISLVEALSFNDDFGGNLSCLFLLMSLSLGWALCKIRAIEIRSSLEIQWVYNRLKDWYEKHGDSAE